MAEMAAEFNESDAAAIPAEAPNREILGPF